MRPTHVTAVALAALLLVIAGSSGEVRAANAANVAPGTLADGEAGVLVLQDGGVLRGQITSAADWYIVSSDGGQIQIEKSRVMLACCSLEEAYKQRRQPLSEQKAEPHLALAAWCLRYNLLTDAGHELADARRIDPDQPRLALLDRRLATMKSQPVANHRAVAIAKTPQKPVKPLPKTPASVADLPDGVVERFTRKVQPVLVNDCTTSGCHRPGGAQSFQLDRALLLGESNRRTTTHNLEAALALVNREHPEQSPLLTIPRKPHGGMAGPIFGPRQEQAYQHLIDWVALIAPPKPQPTDETASADDKQHAVTPAEKGAATPALMPVQPVATAIHGLPASPLSEANRGLKTTPAQLKAPSAVTPAAAFDDGATTLRPPHRLQYGARLEPWRPRDPFDPEIFNRQLPSRKNQSVPAPAKTTAAEAR
jgi:hypothetical protein